MCGRYVSPNQAALERAWQIGRQNSNPFVRRFNVQPTTPVPFLRVDSESGELELVTGRWGMIPHWWKNEKMPNLTFNARVEEAASKPMWRDAMRHSRCLIPAEGWYEWQDRALPATGTRRAKTYRQPFFIHRRDGAPVAFAGLMSIWRQPSAGDEVLSCAILTMAAGGVPAQVHDRMPLVLPPAAQKAWLDPALKVGGQAAQLGQASVDVEEIEYYPVSTAVNSGRAEGAGLIDRIDL